MEGSAIEWRAFCTAGWAARWDSGCGIVGRVFGPWLRQTVPMPTHVVIRAPLVDEIGKLAQIEEEADRRYLDTRFRSFAETSGIPADVARRYIGSSLRLSTRSRSRSSGGIPKTMPPSWAFLRSACSPSSVGKASVTAAQHGARSRARRGLSLSRAGNSARGAMERALVSATGVRIGGAQRLDGLDARKRRRTTERRHRLGEPRLDDTRPRLTNRPDRSKHA